mmetsp:Transcript_11615/g.36032  ORF Transcript_11615/g.36032 Transcript_11615/m.36032 type:complete len:483 (+) Transcript_11615:3-1451(+)
MQPHAHARGHRPSPLSGRRHLELLLLHDDVLHLLVLPEHKLAILPLEHPRPISTVLLDGLLDLLQHAHEPAHAALGSFFDSRRLRHDLGQRGLEDLQELPAAVDGHGHHAHASEEHVQVRAEGCHLAQVVPVLVLQLDVLAVAVHKVGLRPRQELEALDLILHEAPRSCGLACTAARYLREAGDHEALGLGVARSKALPSWEEVAVVGELRALPSAAVAAALGREVLLLVDVLQDEGLASLADLDEVNRVLGLAGPPQLVAHGLVQVVEQHREGGSVADEVLLQGKALALARLLRGLEEAALLCNVLLVLLSLEGRALGSLLLVQADAHLVRLHVGGQLGRDHNGLALVVGGDLARADLLDRAKLQLDGGVQIELPGHERRHGLRDEGERHPCGRRQVLLGLPLRVVPELAGIEGPLRRVRVHPPVLRPHLRVIALEVADGRSPSCPAAACSCAGCAQRGQRGGHCGSSTDGGPRRKAFPGI